MICKAPAIKLHVLEKGQERKNTKCKKMNESTEERVVLTGHIFNILVFLITDKTKYMK